MIADRERDNAGTTDGAVGLHPHDELVVRGDDPVEDNHCGVWAARGTEGSVRGLRNTIEP